MTSINAQGSIGAKAAGARAFALAIAQAIYIELLRFEQLPDHFSYNGHVSPERAVANITQSGIAKVPITQADIDSFTVLKDTQSGM